MKVHEMRGRLEAGAQCIAALVSGVSPEQARWRPHPEAWSVLEVINHLTDEEREGFRVRLDIILHRPGEAWPPIDPQGWVTARAYNQRNPGESLESFLAGRRASLDHRDPERPQAHRAW